MKLSKSFSMDDVTRSAKALELKLDNTLPENLYANALMVAMMLDQVAPHIVSINSWYRNAHLNSSVGGAPDSYHQEALAVDVTPKGPYLYDLIKGLRWTNLQQLIRYETTGHLHISFHRPGLEQRRVAPTKFGIMTPNGYHPL